MENILKNFYCKVCGFDRGYDAWEDGEPDYTYCNCCGCEAGNQDYTVESTYKYRINWINKGFSKSNTPFTWFSEELKVNDWNPLMQLKNIDIDFKDKKTISEYKKFIPNIESIILLYLD